MAISSSVLKYRDGGVTKEVSMYTSTGDMTGFEPIGVRVGGATLYLAAGESMHPNAMSLKVRIGGATKSVLSQPTVDLPSGMVAMFAVSCPTGWTYSATYNGMFLRGAATPGGTGGGSHTHTVTTPASTSGTGGGSVERVTTFGYTASESVSLSSAHTHTVEGVIDTSGSGTNVPVGFTVVRCIKD